MTAPVRQLTSRHQGESDRTDVALASASVGVLPPDMQAALEMRKLQNQIAGQLAGINWGKELDLPTRRAIADWGQQFRVDTTTEIHVLGGNIYLNAAFYLRQLSELIQSGLVEYAVADHVENDPRLKQLGAEGEGEYTRRLRERIMHGIPDAAVSAVVFRIKLRSMDKEVTGAKWCGNGTRKNDPVGDAKPQETSESRAARRAMRLIASHVPMRLAEEVTSIEESAKLVSERVKEARSRIAIQDAAINRPLRSLPAVDANDPYKANPDSLGEIQPQEAVRVTPPTRTPAQTAAAEAAAQGSDPFAEPPLDDSQASADDEPEPDLSAPAKSRQRSSLELWPMPFGGPFVGKPMGDVPTVDLEKLLAWARKSKPSHEFINKATQLLDDRRLGDAEEPKPGEAQQ